MNAPVNTNSGKTQNFGKFLKGVRSELKKVNWPTRKDLTNNTTVVVVSCILATALLWILDTTFGYGLNLFLK